jgi:ABC-2 type transport system ATP-binding protein
MSDAIAFHAVRKSFGEHFSLGPLNLTVPTGSIYALIGPNGAGKSTTLNMLVGAGRPGRGQIEVLGLALPDQEVQVKRRIGFVSPELDYSAWRSVGRAIDFIRGFYPDWNGAKAERLLSQFGLHRSEKIAELSFGARTKLALLLCLSRSCDLLVLDEPTVGLDAVSRRRVFVELMRFMEEPGRTIFISSHQLSDVQRFADHFAVLNRGHVLALGRTDHLLERYRLVEVCAAESLRRRVNGACLVQESGERAQLLLDISVTPLPSLSERGLEVIGTSALTMEELLLALVKADEAEYPWRPM